MDVRERLRRTMERWFAGTWDDGPGGQTREQSAGRPTGGPPTCDLCGRRLLLGERLGRLRDGEHVVVACPVCAAEALRAGCVRATSDHDDRWWRGFLGQVSRVERRPHEAGAEVGREGSRVVAVPRRGGRVAPRPHGEEGDAVRGDGTWRDDDGSGRAAA